MFQFALTVVLLAGAAVMIRSFVEARLINSFIPARHLLTARISLPDGKGERYEDVDARRRMHATLLARLAALPGVDDAALASDMPGLGSQVRDLEIEGHPNSDPKNTPHAAAVFASPNYLATIGLPVLSGRPLNETDGKEGKEAAVVTREFALRFWPGESPVGRRFRFITDGKPAAWVSVVGVCGDIVQDTMAKSPPPLAYLSNQQEPWAWLGIMLRAQGDSAALSASVRGALLEIDPELPLFEVRTLSDAIEHQLWFLKVFGTLFFLFALIALLMASVGIYAVVAQSTSRRTREIGIRMALGSSAGRVVRLILSRGLTQLGIGIAVGLAGAVASLRLMYSVPGPHLDGRSRFSLARWSACSFASARSPAGFPPIAPRGSRRPRRCAPTRLGAAGLEQLRPRARGSQDVPGVSQRAGRHRKATAADAAGELVPEAGKLPDPLVEVPLPAGGQLAPVLRGRGPALGQGIERGLDRRKRNSEPLGHLDDRDAAEHLARIAALVPSAPPARDEALRLVEVDGGHGDAAAPRDVPDAELLVEPSRPKLFF